MAELGGSRAGVRGCRAEFGGSKAGEGEWRGSGARVGGCRIELVVSRLE
jgi:hypothetical protein